MKIKVPFTVPTPDLKKWESKILDVTIHADLDKVVSSDFEYSVVMPDFMFKELADTEPQFCTKYDPNNRKISGLFSKRTLTHKFMKTQTSTSISMLQSYISSLTTFINDKHSVETSTMKKKLFIFFNHSSVHCTNGLNSAYTGEDTNQRFRFFTGYEVMTSKFSGIGGGIKKNYISKIYYASPSSSLRQHDTNFQEREDLFLPLPSYNQSIDDFERMYSIIDWTEEREEFCKKIQDTFKRVNQELADFLKNIDSDKMDMLMSSGGFNFLGTGE